jgi:hypothetical protein
MENIGEFELLFPKVYFANMISRFHQALLIFSTIASSWLAMMGVHEFGHVMNAWLSGGTVSRVALHPLVFSRTDFVRNPQPLFTAWGGALWGIAIPILIWVICRRFFKRYAFLAAFFAGFCLIANGAYLAGGSFLTRVGGDDAGVILQNGGERWQLLLYGLPVVAAGLWFWNGLGANFGLRKEQGEVDRTAAWGMTGLLLSIIMVEILLFGK